MHSFQKVKIQRKINVSSYICKGHFNFAILAFHEVPVSARIRFSPEKKCSLQHKRLSQLEEKSLNVFKQQQLPDQRIVE